MKLLVNLIQIAIAAAIIYVVLNFLDKGNIEQFCREIKEGMTKTEVSQRAAESWVKFIPPTASDKGVRKWKASAIAHSSYVSYSCEIRGTGNKVLKTWISKN